MKTKECKCGRTLMVDDNAPEGLFQYSWDCDGKGKSIRATVNGTRVSLIDMVVPYSAPPGFVWDHKDRNSHNNLASNLRLATWSQNCANRGLAKNNTSGFKGVSWSNGRSKWVAFIMVKGEPKYLGGFMDKVAAAFAYNQAAIENFGEFANLNVLPWPNNVLQGPPKIEDLPRPMMQITP